MQTLEVSGTFQELLEEMDALNQQKKAIEAQYNELRSILEKSFDLHQVDKFYCEDQEDPDKYLVAHRTESVRMSADPQKLRKIVPKEVFKKLIKVEVDMKKVTALAEVGMIDLGKLDPIIEKKISHSITIRRVKRDTVAQE
jgi:hypothetical protein